MNPKYAPVREKCHAALKAYGDAGAIIPQLMRDTGLSQHALTCVLLRGQRSGWFRQAGKRGRFNLYVATEPKRTPGDSWGVPFQSGVEQWRGEQEARRESARIQARKPKNECGYFELRRRNRHGYIVIITCYTRAGAEALQRWHGGGEIVRVG